MAEPNQQPQQPTEQASQPGSTPPQQPVAPGQNPASTNVPGLPPTALSMQLSSLNDEYAAAQGEAQTLGAQIATGGPSFIVPEGGAQGGAAPTAGDPASFGQSSLRDLAEKLAKGYGLNFGRGTLVDPQGNFLQTPDQLAALQGGAGTPGAGLADTAASMNYVAQAINDRKIEQQQGKAIAALQTGLGQVQKRGRGSLAALQSGFYQSMAQVYTDPNLLPEQQDFSYWIQKEQMEEAAAIRDADLAGLGGGGAGGTGSSNIQTQVNAFDPNATDTGPRGTGDVVTSGPHAGQRPVYTYDPIGMTTTVSWESA